MKAMKEVSITDESGTGVVLLCEKHYREYLPKIDAASRARVGIVIKDTSEKGCLPCKALRNNLSPWIGPMFKIWKGASEFEKQRVKDETKAS